MNERITIRVTAEMKAALERFHEDQVAPVRSRQDAFRYIIEDWLIGHDYLLPRSSMRDGRNLGSGYARPSLPDRPFRP